MAPTDRRTTDTRQRLIDTALDLIDADGAQGLTLSAVARACGVSTPACYKHVPDKAALLDAALRELSTRVGREAAAALDDDPATSVLALAGTLLALAVDHPHLADFLLLSPGAVAALDEDAPSAPGGGSFLLLHLVRRETGRLAAQHHTDPEWLLTVAWSFLQGYARLVAAGAAEPDPALLRTVLSALATTVKEPA